MTSEPVHTAGLDWTGPGGAVAVTHTSLSWAVFPPRVSCSAWGGALGEGRGPGPAAGACKGTRPVPLVGRRGLGGLWAPRRRGPVGGAVEGGAVEGRSGEDGQRELQTWDLHFGASWEDVGFGKRLRCLLYPPSAPCPLPSSWV